MRVRLTSQDLLGNSNLELFKNRTPSGWYTTVKGEAIPSEWVLDTTQTLYFPRGVDFVNKNDDFFTYVNVIKSAQVKGNGIYKNTPAIEHVLTDKYKTYSDSLFDTQPTIQDRYVEVNASSEISIRNISTQMQIETDQLRNINYNEEFARTLHIVRNSTGRELQSTAKYNPLTMDLGFLSCLKEAEALDTFFKTCLKYSAGFKVEAFITPDTLEYWGNFNWSGGLWGGFDINGEWVEMFNLDFASYAYTPTSTAAEINISTILQKSEVNNVV